MKRSNSVWAFCRKNIRFQRQFNNRASIALCLLSVFILGGEVFAAEATSTTTYLSQDGGGFLGENGARTLTFTLPANTVSYTIAADELAGIVETFVVTSSVVGDQLLVTITDDGTNDYENSSYPGADVGLVEIWAVSTSSTELSCSEGGVRMANPISLPSGLKVQQEQDYVSVKNPLLSFSKKYLSNTSRWHFSFSRYLEIQPVASSGLNELYLLHRDFGGLYVFSYSGLDGDPGNATYNSSSTSGTMSRTGANNTGDYVFSKGLVTEVYDETSGRLKSLSTPTGVLTFAYAGDVKTVTDSYGNSLSMPLHENLYSNFSISDGAVSVSYSFTDGQLATVTYPGNTSKTYIYGEDADYPEGLTGIVDEKGSRYVTWGYDAQHRANLSTHANNADRFDFFYNNDNTVTVTNSLGKQTIYHYENISGQDRIVQVEGVATASCLPANSYVTFDEQGYKRTVTDANDNVTETIYNERGLIEQIRSGLSWSAGVDSDLVTSTVSQQVKTIWHSVLALPVKKTFYGITAAGYVAYRQHDYVYTANNRIDKVTMTDLTTHTAPYVSNGQTRVVDYGYTYSDSAQTKLASMSVNGPRMVISDVSSATYDASGNLSTITNAAGHTTTILTRDNTGRPLTITDANGVLRTFTYTTRGWLASVSVSGGGETNYDYDDVGLITDVTLANGVHVHYGYDAAYRLEKIMLVESGSTGSYVGPYQQYTLDAAGNITTTTSFDNDGVLQGTVTKVFDELSRLRNVIGSTDLQEQRFDYDLNNNVSATELGGDNGLAGGADVGIPSASGTANTPVARLYDALDRVTTVSQTVGEVIEESQYSYNSQGNIISVAVVNDGQNQITTFQYDGLGDLMQQVSPDTGVTTFAYDRAGNVVQQTDARGVTKKWTYDVLNRVTGVEFVGSPAESITYSYDDVADGSNGVGRLTGVSDQSGNTVYRYNVLGQLTQRVNVIGGIAYHLDFGYDLTGNLTSLKYPNGRIVNYERNALGQVDALTSLPWENYAATSEALISNISYLPFGPLKGYQYGSTGPVHTISHDMDYRVTGVEDTATNAQRQSTLSYFTTGNIKRLSDDLSTANSQDFGYDDANRLDSADGVYGLLGYDYDGVGNRSRLTVDGAIDSTYEYTANSNQLESLTLDPDGSPSQHLFSYSDSGNLVSDPRSGSVYSYNAQNRIQSVVSTANNSSAEYRYNAFGQRIIRTVTTPTVKALHYHYGLNGELLAVTNAIDGGLEVEYIYLEGMRVMQYRAGAIDDIDSDGMDDEWEIQFFGDLSHDGSADSDADGISDYSEYSLGTDPTTAANADRDYDGLPDAWEIAHFGDLSRTAEGDPDGDNLSNAKELLLGYNPLANDLLWILRLVGDD